MNIFLVGLPGSGKSTISKELSSSLGFNLVDTDDKIIEQEESTIEEIFQNKGESYFRKCEQKLLHELISQQNLIVSTGGGLPCFFDNMEIINQSGISVFLNVPTNAIVDRLWSHQNQNRPLLQGKTKEQLQEFLTIKLEERLPYYKKASIILAGTGIQTSDLIDRLKAEKYI
jgi:shikimate kinase